MAAVLGKYYLTLLKQTANIDYVLSEVGDVCRLSEGGELMPNAHRQGV